MTLTDDYLPVGSVDRHGIVVAKAPIRFRQRRDELTEHAELLLDLAMIGEGARLENPANFAKRVAALAAKAIG